MNIKTIQAWVSAFRLRTLPLSLSVVATGSALAAQEGRLSVPTLGLCLTTTLFLQILSNLSNDYGDTVHGADGSDRLGPMRAVQSGAISLSQMRRAMVVFTLLSLASGVALLVEASGTIGNATTFEFLVLGILCIAASITYTNGRHPYGYHGLGGVSVFVFFGLVATLGTEYVLVSRITAMGVCGAVSAGASACVVLGVNNMRDLRSDAAAGKRTLTVILGRRAASALMLGELVVSMVALVAVVMMLKSPLGICGALLAFSIAVVCVNDVWNCGAPDVSDDEVTSVVDFRAMFHHAIGFSVVLTIGYALCLTAF